MILLPEVGDKLFASCSAAFYGEVVGVGHDANKIRTIDIKVFEYQELIVQSESSEFPDFHGLTRLELPEGVYPILRHVQYKMGKRPEADPRLDRDDYKHTGQSIQCHTPGDGCFRCQKLFSIYRKVKGEDIKT
jgi:hypothetical protein